MRNILFAFFTLIITIQGYSQTMNSYFNELNLKFSDLSMEFDMVSNNFDDLESRFFDVGMYFDMTGNEFNVLESLSMNMAGHYSSDVSNWWSQIASSFNIIEYLLDQEVRLKLHDAAVRFDMIQNSLKSDIRNDIFEIASIMNQIGNT
jgi:archaellum component FlaC